jgi:hypothetical protein
MKFPVFLITVLFLSVTKLCAQTTPEKFESALMEMKGGAEVVYSGDKHSFTLDLISDKIKPLEQPGYVDINNNVLQFVLIPNSQAKEDADTAVEKSELSGYAKYELDYVKNEVKLDYQNLHYEWLTINNKVFLLWYYDMPEKMASKKNAIQKQVNLSTVCFHNVLNLNTPVEKEHKFEDSKALLVKVAKTLKQNDFKIDFNELYKKLHQ